jgi:hypothetical protein
MRIENFPKLKRSDHSPKPDEFIDVSLDPSYFSLDSPFNTGFLAPMTFLTRCLKLNAINLITTTSSGFSAKMKKLSGGFCCVHICRVFTRNQSFKVFLFLTRRGSRFLSWKRKTLLSLLSHGAAYPLLPSTNALPPPTWGGNPRARLTRGNPPSLTLLLQDFH